MRPFTTRSLCFNKTTLVLLFSIACSTASAADGNIGWYLKPTLGFSSLSDQSGTLSSTDGLDGEADIDLSSGFLAGFGVGYRYASPWRSELYWEYRSNDSDTRINQSEQAFSGNYASSIFYLNGYYHFYENSQWSLYAGAGLGYVQEIDLDIEQDGIERSYSGDGDLTAQLMLGAQYQIDKRWSVSTELRYSSLSSVDLDGEENAVGTLTGLDYDPLSLQVGFSWRF